MPARSASGSLLASHLTDETPAQISRSNSRPRRESTFAELNAAEKQVLPASVPPTNPVCPISPVTPFCIARAIVMSALDLP